jgi:hypothetical protein
MAGRDDEEVPDQHLGEGGEDPPAQDIDEEPNLDEVPPLRKDTRELRPRGKPRLARLTKEDIFRKLANRPRGTSTPRVKAAPTRKSREDPRPLGRLDIASLIKDPMYPEPAKALGTVELGTRVRTRPTKSVRYNDDLESEPEIDEELDLTRIPNVDSDFYRREPGPLLSRTSIPAPAHNP